MSNLEDQEPCAVCGRPVNDSDHHVEGYCEWCSSALNGMVGKEAAARMMAEWKPEEVAKVIGQIPRHSVQVRILDVDTTEEFVMNPGALPPELRDWRHYRIEYGGCNEECIWEGKILLPPAADPTALVQLLMGMQVHGQVWIREAGDCPVPGE